MPIMVAAKTRHKTTDQEAKPKAKKSKRAKKGRTVLDIEAKLRLLGPYPMVSAPYEAEDYDALTRRRLDWTAAKSRLLAQKHEASRITDIEAIKAKNAPTVEVSIDDPEANKRTRKNTTRVRQSEAWRYKQLTPMQRQAEIEMEIAWRSRTEGMRASVSKYGAVGGGRDAAMVSAAMDATWRDWMYLAEGRGIIVGVVVDCLAEPKTLTDIETERKLKPGKALDIYQRGLDLWSVLRGWIRVA